MTLDDFLGRFPEVVDERDGWLVPCPAHADSHPSLRVAVSTAGKTLLKCRAGCGTDKVLKALGLSFGDLDDIEPGEVKARATSTDTPASPAAVAALAADLDRWAANLLTGGDEAAAYARDRFGLDESDLSRLGLGYAVGLGGGPRLVVPFRDEQGVPRGYQARALDPAAKVRWLGAKSPEGESWTKLAWFPSATGWPEVVVTEGPGDGLTASAAGYDTIAVRGAGLAATVAEDIARMVGSRPVVICGDADPAGDGFARVLAAGLAKLGVPVRKVRPPRDGDDLTDWRGRNPDAFAADFIRSVAAAPSLSGVAVRVDAWTDADLTEVASARRLKEHFEAAGSGVRYSPEAGFFILAGGVWRPDKLDEVRTAAQEVAGSIWAEAAELAAELDAIEGAGDPAGEAKKLRARVGKLKAFAKNANSSKGIDAMVRELKALRGVAADLESFDKHHHLLACRNGVVNLRTGQLGPHDPDLLLTRRVDLDYDPAATAPRWEAFLREVFPHARHAGLPDYMRRLVGYGITGQTDEQAFAVLWGTGANGKSVFTDTLTEVFRELTVTTPFSTFEEKSSGGIPNDLAALKGARLVFAAEGEQGRPMAEAVLKRVTGRDSISARFMRKEFFEFRPTFLLMLATNFKPQFRGQDEGLWRRVKLIPWERYFAPSERDHKLGEKLLAEAAGILAWAVRGAQEWYRDGLGDPPAIVNATKEYRQTSDALTGLLPGVFVMDSDGKVTGKLVWDAYQQWADDENLPAKERWTRRAFFAALEERGAVKKKEAAGIVFLGLRRARQTDAVDDHAPEFPDEERTADSPLADSSSDVPSSGPSLDDIF
ncbi:phage/plasmid primase, P4 family [Micromonospora sp. WMMD980]|uniref:phage/plasmid primase, P4 family n=1 Tax=Micromonospora sp. WMMD980 TaxID=3016088 RepID=UPI00241613E3|nr:phage/plasmid primase, P4 family [Micromonospora sp. WMMD980]MDG4801743.1 phage/plasmid primase, P4 family [Micromonospora sp. WMMD980]